MKENSIKRYESALPVAAGAEMIALFNEGYKRSCDAIAHESKVILCRTTEAYMPPVGQNIRKLRLAQGMTQRQLAYYLKVSMQAVSKWEREQAYPDMSLLVPIARLFSVTLDELFGC